MLCSDRDGMGQGARVKGNYVIAQLSMVLLMVLLMVPRRARDGSTPLMAAATVNAREEGAGKGMRAARKDGDKGRKGRVCESAPNDALLANLAIPIAADHEPCHPCSSPVSLTWDSVCSRASRCIPHDAP